MRQRLVFVLTMFALVFTTFLLNSLVKPSYFSSIVPIEIEADSQSSVSTNLLNDFTDEHLLWFIQITDLHLSEFHDLTRISDFEHFCDSTISIVKPKIVLVTGDITDAKDRDMVGSKQYEFEWKQYRQVIAKSKVLEKSVWLDVRGNHDAFDVAELKSSGNYFKKYGVMGDTQRSYMYEYNAPSGDKYSFIGVDASLDPGPRRPFNFFGWIKDDHLKQLENFNEASKRSNATVWFGHFPTSTVITDSKPLDNVMQNGIAYLSGHLHTFLDLAPELYTRQENGILELELADWKVERMFRILAFDGGIFTFDDFKKNKDIYILITNPKNVLFKSPREKAIRQIKTSKNIRLLVFSKHDVDQVKVFIDDEEIGKAYRAVNSTAPLYLLSWDAQKYQRGIHKIRVEVLDAKGSKAVEAHEFTLEDNLTKAFRIFQSWLLVTNHISMGKHFLFLGCTGFLVVLGFFRLYPKKFHIKFVSYDTFGSYLASFLKKFFWLASVDFAFFGILFSTLYIFIGPWFVGEIVQYHYGVCFLWGIYVKGVFLPRDTQHLTAIIHIIVFQLPLVLHLASLIEQRIIHYKKFGYANLKNTMLSRFIATIELQSRRNVIFQTLFFLANAFWNNIYLIILSYFFFKQIYEFYRFYSFLAVLISPLKTWMYAFAIYLHLKCKKLSLNEIERLIEARFFKKSYSDYSISLSNASE